MPLRKTTAWPIRGSLAEYGDSWRFEVMEEADKRF